MSLSTLADHSSSVGATFTAGDIAITANSAPVTPQRRAEILANPGFGQYFTDHMLSVQWTEDSGWQTPVIQPYGPISLDPASAVLHYGQEIFEGLKVYRHADGSLWTFRPEANAQRMANSARRLALPELSSEDFLTAITALVRVDQDWVSDSTAPGSEQSLYLRPFMVGTEAFLGVRPAKQVQFMVIASPVASYFSGPVRPVSIWLSQDYTRAAPGGTGAAKCGGNYAASLAPQQEAIQHGCDQVCFLDAVERQWIEELGGMNLFFVFRDGTMVTPELTGTILEGITRSSVIQLAHDAGYTVAERRFSIDEWRAGVASGDLTEVFACGTAAVITPVGRLVSATGADQAMETLSCVPVATESSVAMRLRSQLLDIHYGRAADPHGWMHRLL